MKKTRINIHLSPPDWFTDDGGWLEVDGYEENVKDIPVVVHRSVLENLGPESKLHSRFWTVSDPRSGASIFDGYVMGRGKTIRDALDGAAEEIEARGGRDAVLDRIPVFLEKWGKPPEVSR